MNPMKDKILKILINILPEYESYFIDDDMDNLLDSLDVVCLVAELEKEFNITISGIDIIPSHFSSIENIINFLKKILLQWI
jgi:acyl carrier protein